jgi:hypothetical protein
MNSTKEVYLIDPYGHKRSLIVSLEEYITKKRIRGLTYKYIMEVLKELSSEYLDELEKFIEKCREADDAFKDGDEEKYKELLSEANRMFADIQDVFIEKLYNKLPVIYDDFDENGITIVLADGRSFSVVWENYLKIWKGEDWKVVEVRE